MGDEAPRVPGGGEPPDTPTEREWVPSWLPPRPDPEPAGAPGAGEAAGSAPPEAAHGPGVTPAREVAPSPTPEAAPGPGVTPAPEVAPSPAATGSTPGPIPDQAPASPAPGPYPPGGASERPADWGSLDDAFLTIWNHPRETIRRIVEVDPNHWVLALASLGGGSSVLSNASSADLGDRMSPASILLTAVIAGPLAGILTLYVFGWMVRKTGEWFLHGRGTPPQVRAALAWAYVPYAAMLPLLLLATVLVPDLYRSETSPGGPVIAIGMLMAVLAIWSVVIGAHTMAEVQGYRSAWKGLWNLILPGLLLAGVVIVVALVVGVVAGLAGGR